MSRRFALGFSWIFTACLMFLLIGCGGSASSNNGDNGGSSGSGGSGSTSPPVTISISPTSATLAAAGTQQFTATVTNASDTSVTWQVNNVTGGNSTTGTISTGGLYTAPTPSSVLQVTVTAIANADTTKTASAAVTVNPPPPWAYT